jgi:ssDNA-binding Zn-finger/Zn-ribbon topoisomerase 1
MRNVINQKCPLCGTEARFYFVDYENRKYFDCAKCCKFQISVSAENYLENVPKEILAEMSKKSPQAPKGEIMVILESSKNTDVFPREKISIVFTKKSDILL